MSLTIRLRRTNTGTPWGFRLNGGVDLQQPLYIQKVISEGLAYRAGLQPGDGVLQIGEFSTVGATHEQAKMAIIRSGNDLEFTVQRNAVSVEIEESNNNDRKAKCVPSDILESGLRSPVQDPNVQSPSFKLLRETFDRTPESSPGAFFSNDQEPWKGRSSMQDPNIQSPSFKLLQQTFNKIPELPNETNSDQDSWSSLGPDQHKDSNLHSPSFKILQQTFNVVPESPSSSGSDEEVRESWRNLDPQQNLQSPSFKLLQQSLNTK